jgi:hypothetical protein
MARNQIAVFIVQQSYIAPATGIFRFPATATGQIVRVRVKVDNGPAGGTALFDVNVGGTSIWDADQSQRITIPDGGTDHERTGLTAAVTKDDEVTVDFDGFTGTADSVGDSVMLIVEIAETGALATDAQLRDRSTHTGTQTASTISDFASAVSAVIGYTPEDSANKDTDGTLAANSDIKYPSQKAVKSYVDALLSAQDAMIFKGVIDCSSNPNYPSANRGDTYRVSIAGKIGGGSGPNVEAGDILLCITDGSSAGTHASVGANWGIIQVNLDGAVIGPSGATDSHLVQFDGTTGRLLKGGKAITTSTSLAGNSDNNIPTEKAVKAYVDSFSGVASINGDTTGAQIISGADDISVSTSSGTTTIRRVAQTGSDKFVIFPLLCGNGSSGSNAVSANQVRVFPVWVPFRITVAAIYFLITANQVSGRHAAAGLYSSDGNTLLIDSGPINLTNAQPLQTGNAVVGTLAPGWYLLAITCDNASPSFATFGADANLNTIINGGAAKTGTAANSSSGGQLPSSLGTITAVSQAFPIVKIQGS